MIDVIIPNYNGVPTIVKTIQSIYDQNIKGISIAVVDDLSNDNSIKDIKKKFKKVRIIKNKKKSFAAGSRNNGIKNSEKDLLLLVDNDVWLERGCLKTLLKHIDKYDIVAPYVYFEDGSIKIPLDSTTIDGVYPADSAIFLMKRNVTDKVGFFDENYKMYGEDKDFFFRCKLSGIKAKNIRSAKATHELKKAVFFKEEKFYFYIKNFFYGKFKFLGVKGNPFKSAIRFLLTKLIINCLFNYSWFELTTKENGIFKKFKNRKKITERNRIYLFYLFFKGATKGIIDGLNNHYKRV